MLLVIDLKFLLIIVASSPKLEDRKIDTSPDSQKESPRNVLVEKTGSQSIATDPPSRSVSLSVIKNSLQVI